MKIIFSLILLSLVSCSHKPQAACTLKPDPGPCKAILPSFYFDGDKCHQTTWGGCKGIRPFSDLESCKKSCLDR
ncbi:BPTI/Kunitz domain-containing protein [Bacteriovoracaceae bacterium]|nr:BPTI/Kunitz domain-containing protein [Bacteriovoracaceae bacterium]